MLFITCIPGLESLLAAEIEELGFLVTLGSGGVRVADTRLETICALNYHLRLAHRVLLELTSFHCKNKKNLYDGALTVEWSPYFKRGWTLAIDANGVTSELFNTHFSAQVVKDAICDQLKTRPNIDRKTPDVQINLFLQGEVATLYYDTSRIPLYQRGYRKESVRAPMQESLAAAMLRIADYTGEGDLCDPCCGSGTLLIEAAMRAAKMPAGFFRTAWGFQRLPSYEVADWSRWRCEWDCKRISFPGKLVGVDCSSEALAACRANLQAAGLTRKIELRKSRFQEERIGASVVVSNPPYGERLKGKMEPLYQELGDFIRRSKAPVAYILTGWEEGGKALGLPLVQAAPLLNGGLECMLYEVECG